MWKSKSSPILNAASTLVGNKRAKYLLSSCRTEDFIAVLASELSASSDQVLEALADRLGLPFLPELQECPPELLSASKFTKDELEAYGAYIQTHETARYCLATCRPSAIDIEAFFANGIPVALCPEHSIKSKLIEPSMDFFGPVFELINLVKDKGASALFLGIPDESSYCFNAGGKRFNGKVAKELIEIISDNVDLIQKYSNEEISIDVDDGKVSISWGSAEQKQEGSIFAENLFTVAVIDDDKRYTKVVSKLLESRGWTVVSYHDPSDFLNKLQKRQLTPSLVICDLHMGEISGYETLKSIKEFNREIPVLVLTSDESSEAEIEVAQTGADALVNKQSNPQVLVSWCQNIVDRTKGL